MPFFHCAVIVEIIIPFQEKPKQRQTYLMLPPGHYHSFVRSFMPQTVTSLALLGAWNIKKHLPTLFSINSSLVLEAETKQRFSQFSVARKNSRNLPKV